MTGKRWTGLAAIAGVAVAVTAGLMLQEAEKGKLPGKVFDRMKFPKTLSEVMGDANTGIVCHQVILRTERCDEVLGSHDILGHDFRTMTEAQKRRVLIDDSRKDMEEIGLACADPEGNHWFRAAYAQPHCESCGGGCGAIGCPAKIQIGGQCTFNGPDCIITVICCGGPCVCA